MIPKGLINYSELELDRMHRELFRRRPDVAFCAPVNLEKLLQNTKNVVEIRYVSDGMMGKHKVAGCVCKRFMSHDIEIWVDAYYLTRPWAEYSAVLGEEFAHIYLHPALFLYVDSIEDFVQLQCDPEWPRFEGDAKRFSTMVRMPAQLVIDAAEKAYPAAVDEHGFGDSVKIEKILRNALVPVFRVAPIEMQRRMVEWPCLLRDRIAQSVRVSSSALLSVNDSSIEAFDPQRR